MKAKFERVSFNICGETVDYYIKKVKKHWWSRWRIVMDGNAPMRFDEFGNVKL